MLIYGKKTGRNNMRTGLVYGKNERTVSCGFLNVRPGLW
jgi:hypothetical protein